MSTVLRSDVTALRRAAVRATLAPSVHNTQPWRLQLKAGRLELYLDRSRQLRVLDPCGRQLLISCGCALMNARVALAGEGWLADVRRSRRPLHDEPLATVTAVPEPVDLQLAALEPAVECRQTNRRHFSDDFVPDELLDTLTTAAVAEGASLFVVREPDQRVTVAALAQRANDVENVNPAYRAELRAWTTDDPCRVDGVPMGAVPFGDGDSGDEVPMRGFDVRGAGGLPARTESSRNQCLALLGTAGDAPAQWLRAGEALERVLLELTRHGYVATPLTQVTEVPSTRTALRQELDLIDYPHVLLRIGRAAATPPSRRRRLVDVLVEVG